jgi:hypothetical protein
MNQITRGNPVWNEFFNIGEQWWPFLAASSADHPEVSTSMTAL